MNINIEVLKEILKNPEHEIWNKPDKSSMEKASYQWDHIAKPLDSLGKFEDMIIKLAGIYNNPIIDISKRAVIIMCADNGIVEEGVSQSGMEVTSIVATNMAQRKSSVCKMAQLANADTIPIDIGIAADINVNGLENCKIRLGTRNFYKEPAMTRDETLNAILIGIDKVRECKKNGINIILTGEMGIGNTTTSAALVSVLLEMDVVKVAGRGAGLNDTSLLHKQNIIKEAINKYNLSKDDTLKVLETFGGFDIAGLVGVFLGGVIYQMPIVIDGIISAVAALCAYRLHNNAQAYMIPSHMSKEPAMKVIMQELGLSPIIEGNLALGEGTGAVMLLPLLDMSLKVYQDNITFHDIQISDYERYH